MGDLFDERSILLTDRVAVVTGAAQGIGRETALLFARCGATVAICDRAGRAAGRDRRPSVEALGRPVLTAELDVRHAEPSTASSRTWPSASGPVDVLVNNAGGTFVAPFLDVSPKGEATMIAENWTHVTHFIRRPCRSWPTAGRSSTSPRSRRTRPAPGSRVYAAMKTALESLTKTLALELGQPRHPGQLHRPRRPAQRRRARRPRGDARHRARVPARLRPAPRLLRHPGGLGGGGALPGQRPLPLRHRHLAARRRRELGGRRLAPAHSRPPRCTTTGSTGDE